MLKRLALAAAFLCNAATVAWAGGFELPDNGTEALGRGGAFVAKADDGTALEYNVAGFARQPGVHLTVDANLIFHDLAFTAAGDYPGMPSSSMPWNGSPYPTVHDKNRTFPVPFLGGSVRLPVMKGLGIGFGIYGPHSIGSHNYGADDTDPSKPATVTVNGNPNAPAPTRYLLSQDNLLIIYPTVALSLRPIDRISFGAAIQLVYGSFDLENAAIVNLHSSCGPSPESGPCDGYSHIQASGISWAGLFSVLASPTDWLDVGATYRTPIDLSTQGTVTAYSPPITPMAPMVYPTCMNGVDPNTGGPCRADNVTFSTHLPQWLRLGGRLIKRRADGSEQADLELDLTWENWSTEQADHVHIGDFFTGQPLEANVVHNYRDTFGIRVGGAWNLALGPSMMLTPRAGFYFDSAATHYQDTSIDFNTAARYAGTVGLGFAWGRFIVNAAYAYIYSPTRTVNNSELLALSGLNGTPKASDAMVVAGNGTFEASEQILSLGVTLHWDDVLKGR